MSDRSEGWTRRAFVSGLTMAGTGGLLGMRPEPVAAEPPPETTQVRLFGAGLCPAPLDLGVPSVGFDADRQTVLRAAEQELRETITAPAARAEKND